MARPVRRLITGHDENGKAICIEDGPAANVLERPNRPGVALTNIWQTDTAPADVHREGDPVAGEFVLHPPTGGTVFRVIEFHPEDPDVLAKLDGAAAFAEMGASGNVIEGARHPFMHRTETVDYAVVLSGEITMMLDDTDYLLKAGDTVVQRGTNHAWSNQSDDVCVMAFVLIDGK